MFLSLRMHARHWSNPLGRCFFHCGCMPGTGAVRWGDISFRTSPRRPIEPPILTRRTRDQQTGGTGVMGTEGHGRGAGGRQHGQNKHTHLKPHPIGAHRVACGARPRCRRAAAGPGQTTSQRTEQHQRPGSTGVEGAGGTGRHGRGAGGRRQGEGGPRDRPLRAAGSRVAISRAGRRPPAHTAARPFKAGHTAPGTPVGPQATPEIRRVRKRHRHNGRKETPTAPGTP